MARMTKWHTGGIKQRGGWAHKLGEKEEETVQAESEVKKIESRLVNRFHDCGKISGVLPGRDTAPAPPLLCYRFNEIYMRRQQQEEAGTLPVLGTKRQGVAFPSHPTPNSTPPRDVWWPRVLFFVLFFSK